MRRSLNLFLLSLWQFHKNLICKIRRIIRFFKTLKSNHNSIVKTCVSHCQRTLNTFYIIIIEEFRVYYFTTVSQESSQWKKKKGRAKFVFSKKATRNLPHGFDTELHNVKSTVKVLSIFETFFKNMNFTKKNFGFGQICLALVILW